MNDEIDSDHYMILFKYSANNTNNNHNHNIKKHQMIKWKKYNELLNQINTENNITTFHQHTNINDKAEMLTKQMLEASQQATVSIKTNNKPLILPPETIKLIKERRKVRRLYIKTRNPFLKSEINKLKKQIDESIASFKRNSWHELCEKAKKHKISTSTIWKKIKSINNNDKSTPKSQKINIGNIANPTNEDIANQFANNLSSTFNLDVDNFKHDTEANLFSCKEEEKSLFEKISYAEFEKITSKLKKKSATGPDDIQYNHIKNAPKSFKQLIINLFNESIETGKIPTSWKKAKIIMIPKPGKSKSEITSYRPISLTSCFAKCLEKFIQIRLNHFLEKNNIISKHQSGFRTNHSTKDHIFQLSNDVINNFNNYENTGTVFFDLEKAFDKVWHKGLLFKLKKINLPGTLFNWIMHFLLEREFFVYYNSCFSNIYKINAGVPQGCILSPILFSIYISDISTSLSKTHGLYADDISLWKSSTSLKSLESQIQTEIVKVDNFCQKWCLSLNKSKTIYTVFTTAGKRKSYEKIYSLKLTLNGEQIKLEPNPKFLGINFDPKLSFDYHFKCLEKDIQKRINIIKILKSKHWSSTQEFLLNFYKSFIRPLIDYANFPYLIANKTTKDKIQKIHNKILRMCLNSSIYASTQQIHEKSNVQMIEQRQIELSNNYLFKNLATNSNTIIVDKIKLQQQINLAYISKEPHKRQRRNTCLDLFPPTKHNAGQF